MANPLYQQMNANNPMVQKIQQFKNSLNGDPQQIVQNMLNSGKMSQAQFNQYAQRANQIYNAIGKMLK